MIRNKTVFSVSGKLQELLLRESNLDLKKATEICRAFETTSRAKKEMSPPSEGYPIDKIEVQHQKKQNIAVKPQQKDGPRVLKKCKFCGQSHEAAKTQCPAWGKTCNYCKGRNHFEVKCKKVNLLNAGRDSGECDEQWLAVVETGHKRVTTLMQVNDCEVRFQLDSGADVNTICQKFVKKSQVKSTSQKLIIWNKSKVTLLGQVTLEILNPKNTQVSEADFIVVPNDFSCLLGLKTVHEMGLFTINKENFITEVTSDTSQLGNLGEARLHVNSNVTPRALPCRKLPFALQEDVKNELDRLVEIGVLAPVEEWVSQMAVVTKPDGLLRICIDPQPLNEALQREHYRIPIFNDVLPTLNNTKIFSKLDVKHAFWHVQLDTQSSLLTTMITPIGRYRWTRLPFGLKVSSEIFQRKLNEALSGLNGVICIVDGLLVMGCGNTRDEAAADHE